MKKEIIGEKLVLLRLLCIKGVISGDVYMVEGVQDVHPFSSW